MADPLRFRIPASISNFGHGFDALGMAVSIANEVTVVARDDEDLVTPGVDQPLLIDLLATVRAACLDWGVGNQGLDVTITGDVPIARGLGSSSTIVVGTLAALQVLAGRDLDCAEIVRLATVVEGHPDNVVPAGLGGFVTAGSRGDGQTTWSRVPVPDELRLVAAIPDTEVLTQQARLVLPPSVSRAEMVLAVQRSALITSCLASGCLDGLTGLFEDAWHEGHRSVLNPGLAEAQRAATRAGAYGCFLSGSGSTVIALCNASTEHAVAQALERAYRALHIQTDLRLLRGDNAGLRRLS